MKNNYWEEMNMNLDVKEFHEESLKKMGIPEWINIDCPYCHKKLPLSSIRSVGFKLNTRNKGDVFIEIMCEDCRLMNTVYYRGQISKVSEFSDFLNSEKIPNSEPILEENMYKMQYNNIVEEMILSKRAKGEKMSMIKKGTCSSKVSVSGSAYSCTSCGYTEMPVAGNSEEKKCPNCNVVMSLIHPTEEGEKTEKTEKSE